MTLLADLHLALHLLELTLQVLVLVVLPLTLLLVAGGYAALDLWREGRRVRSLLEKQAYERHRPW